MSSKQFLWTGPGFSTKWEGYTDLTPSSPFESHATLGPKRDHVAQLFPHLEERTYLDQEVDKLYCPLTFDAEPFFATGIKESYFNHVYEPFTVLFYVIREHSKEFKSMVDGVSVPSKVEYERLRYSFNKVWKRVLAGRGRGASPGQCSVDEMIRIGSLFYILQRSCDQSEGLVLGDDRQFLNEWSQSRVQINFTNTEIDQYKAKLKNTTMSGMMWENFFFRHVEDTDSRTLWFFHLPNFLKDDPLKGMETEFSLNSLFSVFDKIQLITNREGYFMLAVQDHEEIKDVLKDFFNFKSYNGSDRIFRTQDLWMDINSDESEFAKLITVSNYVPVEGARFRRL